MFDLVAFRFLREIKIATFFNAPEVLCFASPKIAASDNYLCVQRLIVERELNWLVVSALQSSRMRHD